MSEKLQLDDKLFELLPEAEKNSEFIAGNDRSGLSDHHGHPFHCSSDAFKVRF